jgi:type IV pilus assembly protein PilC
VEFEYKAKNKDGNVESDVLAAASRQAALGELRARGLLPIYLTERKAAVFRSFSLSSILSHISLMDKLAFIRNLSLMARSGVPIARGLRILSEQTTNKRFQEVIADIGKGVENGETLSKCFARHPNIFSNLYVSLIEVGEASGNLDQSLDYLASLVKRENELLRKTKGALTYPLVVLATLVMVGVFMFIFVLPKLTATFSEMKVDLPIMTRILIFVVDLFSQHAVIILVLLAAAVYGLIYFFRTEVGSRFFDKTTVSLPVISGITKKVNLARFTLTFGSLLKSGMQIVNALKIAARSMDNYYFSAAATVASDDVRVGISLSDSLAKQPQLFPPLLTQMIKVGEESGTIEEVLKEMGEYYDQEVDQIMKNISSIIEPVLVVVIGAVVGVIAVALIMPIYSITQAI